MVTADTQCAAIPDTSDAETPSVPEAFHIHDEKSANWVVRKIVEARAYREHVRDWAERETRRAERDEAFFLQRYGGELEAWLRHRLAEVGGRRRSIALPGGTVGYRRQPPKLLVTDEPAVIAWAGLVCPDAVETVTRSRLRRRVLTDHVMQTGELPPAGAALQAEQDRLHILSPRK